MKQTELPNLEQLPAISGRFIAAAEKLLGEAANSAPRRKLDYGPEDFASLTRDEDLPMLAAEVDHPLAAAEFSA